MNLPCLYQDDEIIEPSFVKVAPYIQGTLDTHYVKRSCNSNGICFLEFYRSLKDIEPFHVQCYSRANNLVCDHTGSESNEVSVFFVRNFMMKMKRSSIKNVLENNFSVNFKNM